MRKRRRTTLLLFFLDSGSWITTCGRRNVVSFRAWVEIKDTGVGVDRQADESQNKAETPAACRSPRRDEVEPPGAAGREARSRYRTTDSFCVKYCCPPETAWMRARTKYTPLASVEASTSTEWMPGVIARSARTMTRRPMTS